ncbi:SGNH/GDSL hydrolase family protein [Rhodococcus sp. D2-41]|uniref:SGNH/GDSL hydrolase family protein n=1 Tax=Speluncibacter jeojiensis TaxID=2710754 RepID=A0A9X4RD70_9ACTN|nr:SGNH/GDSL hydrolase family protein [Rhodococcus sp. D2-41]MDG3010611.1 SGNH/GDSL hydrolase family protein [Rhodococcus sp. D2-41]MDG3014359.1 SGNH/GDSL hydrolase family protein [Corynebacteriales bacterium D3-21]
MRVKMLPLIATAAIAIGLVAAPAATADPAPGTTYYLSLGDSLAAGYQPAPPPGGDTDRGYANVIYNTLKAKEPGLQLEKLGCDGETTTSMIKGNTCPYPSATSQLDAAKKFLAAHKGQVKYVTINIGANDIYHCINGSGTGSLGSSGVPDVGCITSELATINTNLNSIDKQVRAAGGETPRYVGMNYYNPALAGWIKGGLSRVEADATAVLNNLLSATIVQANIANGFRTADVLSAFSNNDFGNFENVPPYGSLPRNVARICQWTWMCSMNNIHANDQGYQVIADTFLPLLTSSGTGSSMSSTGSAGSSGS